MSGAAVSPAAGTGGRTFRCGPLEIRLDAPPALAWKFAETMGLYDLRWEEAGATIGISARIAAPDAAPARGAYLTCARMLVDAHADELVATTRSGAHARLRAGRSVWEITVPEALLRDGRLEELEDVVSLVLTTGWRDLGWVPLHGAAIVRGAHCALLCAPTGGGKSTMTAAAVRRGWYTLGDDKLLLRVQDGVPELRALLHTFNLHPRTQEWFPEVGAIARLPRYSAWTEKRKVQAGRIWPATAALRARPSALVVLTRSEQRGGVEVAPLAPERVLDTLLRQTVIPAHAATARAIVTTVSRTAAALRGVAATVGADAYRDPGCIDGLEDAIEGTWPA